MDDQNWKDHAGGNHNSQANSDYDVQSTYMPPDPPYDDPFAPSQGSPFVPNTMAYEATESKVPSAVETKGTSTDSVLQFHDSGMPHNETHGQMSRQQDTTSPQVPPVQASYSVAQRLLGGFTSSSDAGQIDGNHEAMNKATGLFSLRRYRTYFNVDTLDVLGRMLQSVIGFVRPDFLDKTAENADLYGPFWIATTLIFVSAVTGNYASYVSYRHDHPGGQTAMESWFYDIDKVGYSAILFYGYVGVIGFLLFAVLKWGFKGETSLIQTWCAYGYSLSVFIPMSFFCVFPLEALRWCLVGVATLTSGLFLLMNFRKPIYEVAGARALPVWLMMAGLHAGLGLALKLYFFHYPSTH